MEHTWENVFLKGSHWAYAVETVMDSNRSNYCLPYVLKMTYEERESFYAAMVSWAKIILPRLALATDKEAEVFRNTICDQKTMDELTDMSKGLLDEFYMLTGVEPDKVVVKIGGMTARDEYIYFYREKEPMEK